MAEAKQIELPIRPDCEKYRSRVEKKFGEYTNQALFVADKESMGCTKDISNQANSNGTWDYCIFQINNEPSVQKDIDKCIQRAWDKFKASGYTWRQWYAVCTPKTHKPKYKGIKCN